MPARIRSADHTVERTALIAATAARRSAVRLLVPLRARQLGMAAHPSMRSRRSTVPGRHTGRSPVQS